MKKIGIIIFIPVLLILMGYVWYVHFNYRFNAITEGKVYKSGKIPPDKIASFIIKNKIKTVIDLRHPELHDALNPGTQEGIHLERQAIKKLTNVRYINIASDQVPSKENLVKFFDVMDKKDSYPVLIHCFHGTGRAILYSAIYRIEYERMSVEEARQKARFIIAGSSFDKGKRKGDFLINYKPRKEGEYSTLNTIVSMY